MADFSSVKTTADGVTLSVRVAPGSKREGIEGLWNDCAVKIALKAPAVEGQANAALIKYLAKTFKIKKSSIFIMTGETSRCKLVAIQNLSTQQINEITTWFKHNLSMENK